jgi:hypothetical protein
MIKKNNVVIFIIGGMFDICMSHSTHSKFLCDCFLLYKNNTEMKERNLHFIRFKKKSEARTRQRRSILSVDWLFSILAHFRNFQQPHNFCYVHTKVDKSFQQIHKSYKWNENWKEALDRKGQLKHNQNIIKSQFEIIWV